jgi:hypothetical protein
MFAPSELSETSSDPSCWRFLDQNRCSDRDLLIEISAFFDSALQARQIGLG